MREGFIFGPFDRPQDFPESDMSLYAYEPNIWPTEFNEMAAVMEEYYRHLAELNKTDYVKIIISKQNFAEFYKNKDLDGYSKFFNNNYLENR